MKTLMRYKSLAKRLYQLLDVPDPLPLSEIFRPNSLSLILKVACRCDFEN